MDIDLMQSLAASRAVKTEFVKTTWAKLLPDFVAGKCDIAVGGISVTLERQKQVSFSTAYMVNGVIDRWNGYRFHQVIRGRHPTLFPIGFNQQLV